MTEDYTIAGKIGDGLPTPGKPHEVVSRAVSVNRGNSQYGVGRRKSFVVPNIACGKIMRGTDRIHAIRTAEDVDSICHNLPLDSLRVAWDTIRLAQPSLHAKG